MYTAVKPVYDRSAKSFRVEVVYGADLILVHAGYLVYDEPAGTLRRVREGTLIGSWDERKKVAVIAHLEREILSDELDRAEARMSCPRS